MRLPILFTSIIITLASCQTAPVSSATSLIENPIDRVRAAYQVDRLREAKTIRIEGDIRQDYPDHEYSPDFHDMSAQRMHHVIDIHNSSGSSEYLTRISNTHYHGRSVLVDGTSRFIIYPSGLYQQPEEVDFISEYGPTIRSSEAMLALWLDKSADTARLEGEEMWLGNRHDKVTFDFPNSPPLTVLIQKDTGYISKMSRLIGNEILVSYTFNYHTLQDGIPVAKEHNLYAGEDRILYSFNRGLTLNDRDDRNAFEVESDILPEPERMDQSAMTAEAITDTMHQVGQGESYTTFIKTAQGLVAFGVEAGFESRLQAYREETADQTPLGFAIIANHHNVRMEGASEAVAAGATLLVTPDAEARVRAALDEGGASKVEKISASKTIDNLTIYNIATSTASENLVLFDEKSASVVQTSHYAAPFKDAPLIAEFTGVTLMQGLDPLELSPNLILSTDSRRAENWNTFEEAVSQYVHQPCVRDRKICEGWF